MPKKKATGKHKQSSGQRRSQELRQKIRRVKMKIARWKRNQSDPSKVAPLWRKDQKVRRRTRHDNWDTRGLEKYLKDLEAQSRSR